MTDAITGPGAVVERLAAVTNAHDLDGIVACFVEDYRNQTPLHPERSFTGREQVRRNWSQILGAIADLRVEVLATAVEGSTVWSEWEHRGTRPNGSPHVMRGVIIFAVEGDVITAARFYLEPVPDAAGTVDDAVHRQIAGGPE